MPLSKTHNLNIFDSVLHHKALKYSGSAVIQKKIFKTSQIKTDVK
jgi:hypothetical protein